MMRYRVGAIGPTASGKSMAEYFLAETLRVEAKDRALYYAGEVAPLSQTERLAQEVINGTAGYMEAYDELMLTAIRRGQDDGEFYRLEERIAAELAAATDQADARAHIEAQGGSIATVRPDMAPDVAALLGLNPDRPPTAYEIAYLLNGKRADGEPIEGKRQNAPMQSVAEAFGLDSKRLPSEEEIDRVLGDTSEAAEGARKRFLGAVGLQGQEPTAEQIAALKSGLDGDGKPIMLADYKAAVEATRPPVAYVEMIFSPDKTLSVAWALAPSEPERAMMLQVHRNATEAALRYSEELLGNMTIGNHGDGGVEGGWLGWVRFDHYTARPTAEIVTKDESGREYTEQKEVPVRDPDPQLHSHVVIPNAVLTESGRVGSMDLDRLDGVVKEIGAVYQAYVARECRAIGVGVKMDERTGAARLTGVSDELRSLYSKRSHEANEAAREYARERGKDWESLSDKQKIALLERGKDETRNPKVRNDGNSNFASWEQQETVAGLKHRSVIDLGRQQEGQGIIHNPQHRTARDAAMPLVTDAFDKRAKIGLADLRVMAARGLIEGGIGNKPGEDINAVVKLFHTEGVKHSGQHAALAIGREKALRGKERWSVTTDLHERQERLLIGLAREIHADRSTALRKAVLDKALDGYLKVNPKIDPEDVQWKAQREMAHRLARGGRFEIAIGVAGCGKSSILTAAVSAWHADGRTVYGVSTYNAQVRRMGETGIADHRLCSVAAFFDRVQKDRYRLDSKSVVVIDEVSLIGKRQMLELLTLQKRLGFQVAAVGDPRQCNSVEAGPVIAFLEKALGKKAIPRIVTTIRQKTEREADIAMTFRKQKAAAALAMKREDKTVELVVGGKQATIDRVAAIWHERKASNADRADFTISVSAPTNADARAISSAIRQGLQERGALPDDKFIVRATDRTDTYNLALSPGDRVRMFDRVFVNRKPFGANADIVDVVDVNDKGMTARDSAGRQAFVQWNQLRKGGSAVRLAHGYATTIDATQSLTSDEHIDAMPSGTKHSDAHKVYSANSRHRETTWMVLNESAERAEVSSKLTIGTKVLEPQIWENAARNLSRVPTKAMALDFLERANGLRLGTISSKQRTAYEGAVRMPGKPSEFSIRRATERLAKAGKALVAEISRAGAQIWDGRQKDGDQGIGR